MGQRLSKLPLWFTPHQEPDQEPVYYHIPQNIEPHLATEYITPYQYHIGSSTLSFLGSTGDGSVRVEMDSIIAEVKKSLGFSDAIVKCMACGQWGAVKTACRHCGAPIDPGVG